jgi:hypothetical protein
MNKVDRLAGIDVINRIMQAIHDFKYKYSIGEGAFWDLMSIYWHEQATGKGTTIYQLGKMRYNTLHGSRAIFYRRTTLIQKGLVILLKNGSFLTPLARKEIEQMLSIIPEQVLKTVVAQNYKK